MKKKLIPKLSLTICIFLFVSEIGYSQLPTISNSTEYEHSLGKKIARALHLDCSVSNAIISDVNSKEIEFSVNKFYRVSEGQNINQKNLTIINIFPPKTNVKHTTDDYFWLSEANLSEGAEAMVFLCRDTKWSKYYGFVTTNKKYFNKIQSVVKLTENFRKDSNSLINFFASELASSDPLTKSVTVNFLLGARSGLDAEAYVATNLLSSEETWLNNKKIWHTSDVPIRIQQILSSQLKNHDYALRRKTFTNLIKIANGDGNNAIEATRILAYIANSNSIELKSFLDNTNKNNLATNLSKIPDSNFASTERQALTKLLFF